MATVTLTKWGNSIGIRIPSIIVKEAHLVPGEELTLRTSNNPVIARQRSCRGNPENKAFRLNQYTNPPRVDLISQSTPTSFFFNQP